MSRFLNRLRFVFRRFRTRSTFWSRMLRSGFRREMRRNMTSRASLEAEMRYLNYSPFQKIVGRSFRWATRLFFKTAFRLKTEGTDWLPTESPCIVAANHTSHLDSPAALSALGRASSRFHVLGAKDYFFDSYAKGWAVNTLLNVLPFDRRGKFFAQFAAVAGGSAPRAVAAHLPRRHAVAGRQSTAVQAWAGAVGA